MSVRKHPEVLAIIAVAIVSIASEGPGYGHRPILLDGAESARPVPPPVPRPLKLPHKLSLLSQRIDNRAELLSDRADSLATRIERRIEAAVCRMEQRLRGKSRIRLDF